MNAHRQRQSELQRVDGTLKWSGSLSYRRVTTIVAAAMGSRRVVDAGDHVSHAGEVARGCTV